VPLVLRVVTSAPSCLAVLSILFTFGAITLIARLNAVELCPRACANLRTLAPVVPCDGALPDGQVARSTITEAAYEVVGRVAPTEEVSGSLLLSV